MAPTCATKRERRRSEALRLLGGVCVACGVSGDLQFDHVYPRTKVYAIATMLSGCSWASILAELDKCQILCQPCHVRKGALGCETGGSKGAAHHSAKLTDPDVRRMRALYTDGVTPTELGRMFGVTRATASKAVNRRTWRHLQ